ncbi:E3 ubiquitin-protein ligase RNF138 isoform X1 [Podarcis raffonei]|uniref:E3 ubiquitin-protein ligase RNF138 n=4 Tax=Lacertinae TaxID=162266 RepID=A0A670I787_PODMU|nr:E3 ubiquitin-protein ligase RNF138 isoform X1 [Podarcis raffonei]CAI5779583.1 E3 ubiquitin-protein ligase RNF138 isoform X1 [Podarcis lilfordi]
MESGGGLTGLASGSPEDPGPAPKLATDLPVLPKEVQQFAAMNEEPATICFNEDDYYCPVCQDVFKTPVRISACQHVFCRKCFLMAMKEGGTHCPLCRGIVTRKEKARPNRALDVENNMKKLVGSCRCCDKQIRFSRMRQHYKSCKKYQDEYGVSSVIPSLDISQDSTGNSFRSDSSTSEVGENSNLHVPEEATSGQPTFKCPLCQESNFTRQNLLDHCNDRHLYQLVPVICPICVSFPWGDPNRVTRDFVGHLNLRHQFEYGDFMNPQLDEETLFQNAVEESCQENL